MQPAIRAVEDRGIAASVTAVHRLPGVAAGSALLRVGERLLAVHDDAYCVTWIDPLTLASSRVVLRGDGAPLPKPLKPDFEAAIAAPDGAIYVLGSGSTARRCEIARVGLDGAVAITPHLALYRCVRTTLALESNPNLEGATVHGERLRLFHRGVAGARSATVDLNLRVLEGDPPAALDACWFELGSLDGVGLGFTDAAAVPGGTAFVATAEDTHDAVLDGPVAGSVIGWTEISSHSARWTRLVDAAGRPWRAKVEGLALDEDLRGGWLLTDSDDAGVDAQLARFTLSGRVPSA